MKLFIIFTVLAIMWLGTKAQSLPTCSGECTHTQGFWKNHHSGKGSCPPDPDCTWPICESTGVTAEQNTLCGLPWLTIFNTPPKGSAWFILAHQFIAAQLNLKDERCDDDTVAAVVSVLGSSKNNLEMCLLDTTPGSALGMDMISQANFLDAFNNGHLGPEICFGDDDNGSGDDDDAGSEPGQDCGERTCRIVEICEFENPPSCNGAEDDCCTCSGRSFDEGCCTRTRGYWSNHNSENCPGNPNTRNCTVFTWADDSENKLICEGTNGSVTWLDVFDIPNNEGCDNGGNAWNQLAAQFVAASLNVIHNQACITVDVATALAQASMFLEANCDPRCIDPTTGTGIAAIAIKDILDEYNNGIRGPGHCEECECPDCPPLSK